MNASVAKSVSKQMPKRDRILDVAEHLFSKRGYDGVTLRQIASGAEVDVALASYHFGKKIDLFKAVLARRAGHFVNARLQLLREAKVAAAPNEPSVEAILTAFLQPLDDDSDENSPDYTALIGFINSSPQWAPTLMSDLFDGLVHEFIDALHKAIPGSNKTDLYWCYNFLSGAVTVTAARTGRVDRMSKGLCNSQDFKAQLERMIPFFTAGFNQVCKP